MDHISLCLRVQFVRVQSSTDPVLIYQMLTEEWGLASPHLVVALVGGDELAQMKPWLRDTLRKGLVKAAQSTGVHPATRSDLSFSNPNRAIDSVALCYCYWCLTLFLCTLVFLFSAFHFFPCLVSLGFRKVPLSKMNE